MYSNTVHISGCLLRTLTPSSFSIENSSVFSSFPEFRETFTYVFNTALTKCMHCPSYSNTNLSLDTTNKKARAQRGKTKQVAKRDSGVCTMALKVGQSCTESASMLHGIWHEKVHLWSFQMRPPLRTVRPDLCRNPAESFTFE